MKTLLSSPREASDTNSPAQSSGIAPAAPAIERLVAGKYRVERVLGHGGSGLVVLATHIHLDQRVAIKTMLKTALQYRNALERFAREARAAARIQSEHVVRIFDVGVDDEGLPYIVMEYLEGCDLWEALEERRALPVDEAIRYAMEICEALSQAHAVGIVHRDLKPANVFLARRADGSVTVKVLDFGMSKFADRVSERPLTDPRLVMGTPGWMSPEQLRSTHDVDVRSDVWCTGAILYNMLAGRPAYEVDTVARAYAPLSSAPDPPSRQRAGIPLGLDAVVLKCLRNDRRERFQTVTELARALAEFGRADARHLIDPVVRIVPPSIPSKATAARSDHHALGGVARTPSERFSRRSTVARPRRGVPLVVATSAIVALLGLARSLAPQRPTAVLAAPTVQASSPGPTATSRENAPSSPPPHVEPGGVMRSAAPAAAAPHPPGALGDGEGEAARTKSVPAVRAAASDSSDAGPLPPLLHPEFGERK
jgi:serine/threonine protein kinase